MAINSVTISGNITRDMEVHTNNNGYSFGEFSVAVNERRKNQQGEWEDKPHFFDCKMLGDRAPKIAPYLTKGTKVAVIGKLQQDRWEDKNGGGKRSKVYILVNDIEFMSRGYNDTARASQPTAQQNSMPMGQNMAQQAQQAVQQQWQGAVVSPYADADLPF